MNEFTKEFQNFTQKYLGRNWLATDGLTENEINAAEKQIGVTFPAAMKSFYLTLGAATDFCSIQNFIVRPNEVFFDGDYLMFMDENQGVVSWGIKRSELSQSNPIVWQRNNKFNQWYSEEKSFSQLLTSMFDWYQQLHLWKNSKL